MSDSAMGRGSGAQTTGDTGQPDNLSWDPFDESLKNDPHPVWRRLRDEAPRVLQR
jgi:hypothetical protein